MKTVIQHATLALFLAFGLPLSAQEPAPGAASQPAATPARPLESGSMTLQQPALETPAALPLMPFPIPSTASGTSEVTGSASPSPTPTPLPKKGTIEQLRQDVRIRELKTRLLLTDSEINAQRAVAENAKTSNGRRTAMRNYYTMLATRIERIDPSLTRVVERVLYGQLYALEQHKVWPAKLIEPITPVKGSRSEDHIPPDLKTAKPDMAAPPGPEESTAGPSSSELRMMSGRGN